METIVFTMLFLYYFVVLVYLLYQHQLIKYLRAKNAVLEGTLNFYQGIKYPDLEYYI